MVRWDGQRWDDAATTESGPRWRLTRQQRDTCAERRYGRSWAALTWEERAELQFSDRDYSYDAPASPPRVQHTGLWPRVELDDRTMRLRHTCAVCLTELTSRVCSNCGHVYPSSPVAPAVADVSESYDATNERVGHEVPDAAEMDGVLDQGTAKIAAEEWGLETDRATPRVV